jgi:hypothetical protein
MAGNANATTFEVTEIPTYIDNQLNCGEFVAGLLVILLLLLIVILPTMYLTKGKAYGVYIILSMAVLAPLVGLGWFPVYVYIIILFLIALKFSQALRDFLGSVGR